jgi:hypothetical protein
MMRTFKLNSRRVLLATLFLLLLTFIAYMPGGLSASASGEKHVPLHAVRKAQTQALSVADGGAWSALIPTSNVPVHLSLLPDGRLLYWGRDKAPDGWDDGGKSKTFLLDPLYPETNFTTIINTCPQLDPQTGNCLTTATNLFCSGHSFLPDGRLLVTGGHNKPAQFPSAEGVGEKHINIFDYRANTWTRVLPEMDKGRWYPYNVTLANGETIAIAGAYWNGESTIPLPGGGVGPRTQRNTEPSVRDLAGGVRTLSDNGTGQFANVPNYPYVSLNPDGKVFIATPSTIPGVDTISKSRIFDPFATNSGGGLGVYTNSSKPANPHIEGSSVMYAPGKVLLLGGYTQTAGAIPTNTAEAIDFTTSNPAWTPVGSMAWGRHYPTATLLPDGKVLVTGGTTCGGANNLDCGPDGSYGGAVQTPELWDPSNPSQWRQMNATTSGVPRVYHSVAMLMPDARVLVGGGGLPYATGETTPNNVLCKGPNEATNACRHAGHKDIEFFSPPYLFNADGTPAVRPVITDAPSSLAYGQPFTLDVGNVSAEEITQVVLVRLPSVTHTYNQDQRRVSLKFAWVGPIKALGNHNYLNVSGPANGLECPPGPYMMFLIRDNGGRNTPSLAKFVRVGDFSINATSQAFPATAIQTPQNSLTGTINVNAAAGVNWVAEVDAAASGMLTITSGNSGLGNGTVNFSVAPNVTGATPNQSRRAGKIRLRVPGRDAVAFDFTVYQSGNFSDVSYPTTAYFDGLHRFISNIYARGITAGCGNGNYCTGNSIARQDAAVFLTVMLNPSTLPTPLTQRYGDVPTTHGLSKFIEYLARRNIPETCAGNNFCPTQPLTRKDMVVWLLRARGIDRPPAPTMQRFSDVPLSDPAAPFVEEAARRGITAGCGNGMFCPNTPVTRGQMAVFFVATFGL